MDRSGIPTRTTTAFAAALLMSVGAASVRADEGMWTYNNFPADRLERAYGFRPDQRWLDHLQLSSVRLAGGCSGAFVTAHGLVQTNHHCARGCIQQLSTAQRDLVAIGFYAREAGDEIKCPAVEINQLIEIGDVTERMSKAVAGKEGPAFSAAMNAEQAAIAGECARNDDGLRCDVVELYHGGVYNLYKYRRYQDVRLVFAPEEAIAFFGGDPDNFEFPRYNLDVSYLRVYDKNGAPLDTSANFLRYAAKDVAPGELTFTSGHPGSTHRLDTVAALEYRRDLTLPYSIFNQSELRGLLTEFSRRGPEQARIARAPLFGIENGLKSAKGQYATLVDPSIIRDRRATESDLRAKVNADPALRAQYGRVWDDIRATLDRLRPKRERFAYVGGSSFQSRLFSHALNLVWRATEVTKPDAERLPEYADASFPALRQSLLSTGPIYPELEKLTLTHSLTKMREVLGPDDPFVRKVLGKKSPEGLAAELIDGTKLGDVELRKRLIEADAAAIAASDDPMIVLARTLDGDLRASRKESEDTIEAPLTQYSTQVAQAMFKVYGTSTYPDATFTLRVSYGTVAGYRAGDKEIPPMTVIGGVFDRATGSDPFKLPQSWIAAQSSLNPRQPFNFVTTNDIVGGNSGSPMVNRAGEVVGLIFDGNLPSLGGTYGYDIAVNRAVAVNVGAMREALAKVYRADRIVKELAE
jgi:hypothetical protein